MDAEEALFFEAALTALARALHAEGAMDIRSFVAELQTASAVAAQVGQAPAAERLKAYALRLSKSAPRADA